jgi:hypothetical protein
MFVACWIIRATDTHSEYEILIAFAQQQWLLECASMLCYTYSACLVRLYIGTPCSVSSGEKRIEKCSKENRTE